MCELQMDEVLRTRNPSQTVYLWMQVNPNIQASRIDFAIASIAVLNCIENITYCPGIRTDHIGLFIALDLIKAPRGPGYWKINNLLLTNYDYVPRINQCLEVAINESCELKPDDRWLYIRKKVRNFSKEYSKTVASEKELIISQLSERIMELEHKIAKEFNQKDYDILKNSKNEIEELLDEKNKSIIFHTKCRWYEGGEANTKMFFNMEKSRYNARVCAKLLREDGVEITDPTEILDEQHKFYQELYTSNTEVKFDLHNKINLKIPKEIRNKHETPFSKEEVTRAVHQMARDKIPGIDGLSADFFKMFWSKIQDVFYDAIIYMYEKGALPKKF